MKKIGILISILISLSLSAATPYLGSVSSFEYVKVDGTAVCLILISDKDTVISGLVTSVSSCSANEEYLSELIESKAHVFTDISEVSPVDEGDHILDYLKDVNSEALYFHLEEVESLQTLKK